MVFFRGRHPGFDPKLGAYASVGGPEPWRGRKYSYQVFCDGSATLGNVLMHAQAIFSDPLFALLYGSEFEGNECQWVPLETEEWRKAYRTFCVIRAGQVRSDDQDGEQRAFHPDMTLDAFFAKLEPNPPPVYGYGGCREVSFLLLSTATASAFADHRLPGVEDETDLTGMLKREEVIKMLYRDAKNDIEGRGLTAEQQEENKGGDPPGTFSSEE